MNSISRQLPSIRILGGLAVILGMLLPALLRSASAAEVGDAEIENRRCLNCHGQSHIAAISADERKAMVGPGPNTQPGPPTRPGIFTPPSVFKGTAHENVPCVSCHVKAKNLPHPRGLGTPSCNTGTCHEKQAGAFVQSVHAMAAAKGEKKAPTCVTCHGGHAITSKQNRQARTNPLNSVKICADCHQKHDTPASPNDKPGHDVKMYLDSVHGRALLGGTSVAASCADCHGAHNVQPSSSQLSPIHRENVPATCGKCHPGVTETYATSIHGEQMLKGVKTAPVCSDCHTAHAITRTDMPAFKTDIVAECGTCHDKPMPGSREKASLYETYRASYHGQVTQLGFNRAARCSDCHGSHAIKRIADPTSTLHADNRVATCRKCHPGADAKFATFAPHADFRNSDRYPILHYVFLYFAIMMTASFGFFGLHCILWFIRSIIERIKHGPHPKPDYTKSRAIRRFSRVDRLNHGLVIISFFGLALTGLPLLYSDKPWARTLAGIFGGIQSCGIFHRFFAIMLITNFVIHGVGVFRRFRKYGVKQMLFGPTTMLPRIKDLKDALGMFRWFFVGGPKPKFDRWTYWEKFDYTAEVGGSAIIGISGLLLWFPVFFSSFVPGWMFNVASIVHGFEALLAVGFIFTIHFFNAHLRMEKFPVDDVMFTGRLPEEEFKHERGAEYDRAVASGEIEKLRVDPPPAWYRHFAVALGISAMLVGTTIVVLIILAALRIL